MTDNNLSLSLLIICYNLVQAVQIRSFKTNFLKEWMKFSVLCHYLHRLILVIRWLLQSLACLSSVLYVIAPDLTQWSHQLKCNIRDLKKVFFLLFFFFFFFGLYKVFFNSSSMWNGKLKTSDIDFFTFKSTSGVYKRLISPASHPATCVDNTSTRTGCKKDVKPHYSSEANSSALAPGLQHNKKKCNLTLAMSPTCHSNNTLLICWYEFFLECTQ